MKIKILINLIAILFTFIVVYGIKILFFNDFFYSIIPGWHTTIYPINRYLLVLIIVFSIICIFKFALFLITKIFYHK